MVDAYVMCKAPTDDAMEPDFPFLNPKLELEDPALEELLAMDDADQDPLLLPLKKEKPSEQALRWQQEENHSEGDPLIFIVKEENSSVQYKCHHEDKKPLELQAVLQQSEAYGENNPGCSISPLEVQYFTCTLCVTNFHSKKALRKHFIGSENLRFCRIKFNQSQPFVKLIRMRNADPNTSTSVHKLTKAGLVKSSKNTLRSTEIIRQSNVALHPDRCSPKHSGTISTFACAVCKKLFKSKQRLATHMLEHSVEQPASRAADAQALETESTVSKHMQKRTKTLASYSCDVCKKVHKGKRSLVKHMKLHLNERSYSCTHCPKTFASRKQRHTHGVRDVHVCDVCNKALKGIKSLVIHKRSYCRKGPYSCTYCPKTFLSRTQRSAHKVRDSHACDICKIEVRGAYNMANHMQRHNGERPFGCTVCSQKFSLKSDLKIHLRKHPGSIESLVCDFCKKLFCTKSSLVYHILRHTGERPFACASCSKTFVCRGNLTKHENIHKGLLYKCLDCNKDFSCKQSLVNHMRIHTGERPYTCKICPETFPNQDQLTTHSRKHPGAAPTHVCGVCKKELSTKKNLKSHMRIHTGRPFKCKDCPNAYTTQGHLTKHYACKHSENSTHFCHVCKKELSTKTSLTFHMRLHSSELPFSCKDCPKTYAVISSLKKHELKHTETAPSFVCDICKKKLCNKFNLANHMRIHTGERPYLCKVCPARFATKEKMNSHTRLKHTEIQSFVCNLCQKNLSNKKNLVTHMRIHTGVRPYPCTLCPKSFNRPNLLAIHVNQHSKDGIGDYVCGICKRSLGCGPSLKRHMRLTHARKQS